MRHVLACLVLVLLIGGLPRSLSAEQRNDSRTLTPSAATGPRLTADDRACGAFAEEHLPSDVGFSQEGIEILAGCRRTVQGDWFVPAGPHDPRLPGGAPLTREEETATTELRRRLTAQLATFDSVLARTSYYGLTFSKVLGDMQRRLSPPYKTLQYRNRQLYRSVQGPYEEVLVSYMANPDHSVLAEYVAWWMSRREAARPLNLALQMNPMLLTAFLDLWDFTRAPWPWELADPLTLDEYLDWALANGRVLPSRTDRGTTGGPGAADCTKVALWMGETLQRKRQASTIINNVGPAPVPDEQAAQGFK